MTDFFAFARIGLTVLEHHVVRRWRLYLVGVLVPAAALYYVLCIPPTTFTRAVLIEIPEGTPSVLVADQLEDEGLIHSSTVFRVIARITGTDEEMHAGKYLFTRPIGLVEVLYRVHNGISGIETISVTFPEGITVREMADILEEKFPYMDTALFLEEANAYEGYLFPDTYELYPDTTPKEIIDRMQVRFDEVWTEVEASNPRGIAQEDAVIMASLLEKETKVGPDRAIASGILWSRIDIGMALQVDAVFGYIKGISTYHPSGDDLLIDSPYNTYENRGLPPGPIGNPGKDALEAALNPTETAYLYYLTGNDGAMYYAETFEEHKANKEAYLR